MCRRMVTGVYEGGRTSDTNVGSGVMSVSGATALKRISDIRGAAVRTTRWGVALTLRGG